MTTEPRAPIHDADQARKAQQAQNAQAAPREAQQAAQRGPEVAQPRAEVVAPPEERVEPAQRGEHGAQTPSGARAAAMSDALFSETDSGAFSQQWEGIQAAFVDDPRQAVQRADQLVDEAIRRLTETFSRERARLEQQWSRGDDASTEDLRVAFQRYRSFFQRLLSA